MRCPKCHYLGFEPEPRCKHCGYDFSLSAPEEPRVDAPPESPVAPGDVSRLSYKQPDQLSSDFDLRNLDFGAAPAASASQSSGSRDLDFRRLDASPVPPAAGEMLLHARAEVAAPAIASEPALAIALETPVPAAAPIVPSSVAPIPAPSVAVDVAPRRAAPKHVPARRAPAPITTDLPLFVKGIPEAAAPASRAAVALADDEPLIAMSSAPRAPLSVRRATPDPARLRATYAKADSAPAPKGVSGNLLDAIELRPDAAAREESIGHASSGASVGPSQRLIAATLDALLLGGLNAAVVSFTLEICQLSIGQLVLLQWLPMVAFLLLFNVGYLVLFTVACGQTLGKMAAGIRVVATSEEPIHESAVSLAQATGRAIGSMVSLVPLGLGFWFALSSEGRALHDRMAHTRVVRA